MTRARQIDTVIADHTSATNGDAVTRDEIERRLAEAFPDGFLRGCVQSAFIARRLAWEGVLNARDLGGCQQATPA